LTVWTGASPLPKFIPFADEPGECTFGTRVR
jgi:hypothetical protein